MEVLYAFDQQFIAFCKRYSAFIGRVSLFVIFFGFGFLKIIGLSPANELALGFAEKMGAGLLAQELYLLLAVVECIIGIIIMVPNLTRFALFIMFVHMMLVSSPIILYSEAVWVAPLVPNLEGQYIIKNAALVALALGLVASTSPLRKS